MIAEQKGLLPTAQASAILDVYARLGLPCSIKGITSETYKRARDEIVVHRDGLLRAPNPNSNPNPNPTPNPSPSPSPGSNANLDPNQVRRCRRASARASTWTISPMTRSTRPSRGCRHSWTTLTLTLTLTLTRTLTRTPTLPLPLTLTLTPTLTAAGLHGRPPARVLGPEQVVQLARQGREPGVNENGVLATYAPTPPMRLCTSTPISRAVVLAAAVACSAAAASCSDTASNLHCSVLSIMRRASVYHVFILF